MIVIVRNECKYFCHLLIVWNSTLQVSN
ncbi:hypothetical protein H6H03_05570 [Nostoc paludosum FACHB-159]|uniref:Endothelin-like toxin domain-containing protein n=1 Tax=Nostoc paludosum FACHB-159 TaxID=2692908 RepID=A0ABR8K1S5_9NOSO|nr:hypothetical protein [Nostoc sp. FACHB-857]MBD2733382.1 hypothetical protein [Nostoc paludosum FACHB-159]